MLHEIRPVDRLIILGFSLHKLAVMNYAVSFDIKKQHCKILLQFKITVPYFNILSNHMILQKLLKFSKIISGNFDFLFIPSFIYSIF